MPRATIPHKLKATIASRLKKLMKRDDITQHRLADDLNLTSKDVNKYINATHSPMLETLIAMADYFKVSVAYLLGRTQSQEPLTKLPAPDDLKAFIGKTLDSLLERDDVSQYRLAKDLKVTDSAISLIRKAVNTPSLPTLIAIADHFNVSTDYLLGRTDDAKGTTVKTDASEE